MGACVGAHSFPGRVASGSSTDFGGVARLRRIIKDWLGNGIVCHENWIGQGIEIVVAALVPVVVILYLVFAETGMRSLARRTNESLEKIVPLALRSEETTAATYSDGIESCVVATSAHAAGSISAYYLPQYRLKGNSGALRLTVAVNVDKAVVVFFLPVRTDDEPKKVRQLMAPTMKGAEHEGYIFDEELVETTREGRRFFLLIASAACPPIFFGIRRPNCISLGICALSPTL